MRVRDYNIDLLKALACLGVVGLHTFGAISYTLYYLCTFSVPVFFMVNGYLMMGKERVTWKYASRKALGVLKVVLLWNILIMIPVALFRRKLVNPIDLSVKSMLQEGYLWHFWFLGSLVIMYLLLPFGHMVIKKHPHAHRFVCSFLLGCSIYVTVLSCVREYPMMVFVPQSMRLWTWMLYFLIGGYIGEYKKHRIDDRKKMVCMLLILAALTVAANIVQKRIGHFLYHQRMAEFFYDEIVVIVWITFLFYLLTGLNITNEGLQRVVTELSGLSFGVYILHPLIMKAVEVASPVNEIINTSPYKNALAVVYYLCIVLLSFAASKVMSKIPLIKELVKL